MWERKIHGFSGAIHSSKSTGADLRFGDDLFSDDNETLSTAAPLYAWLK